MISLNLGKLLWGCLWIGCSWMLLSIPVHLALFFVMEKKGESGRKRGRNMFDAQQPFKKSQREKDGRRKEWKEGKHEKREKKKRRNSESACHKERGRTLVLNCSRPFQRIERYFSMSVRHLHKLYIWNQQVVWQRLSFDWMRYQRINFPMSQWLVLILWREL